MSDNLENDKIEETVVVEEAAVTETTEEVKVEESATEEVKAEDVKTEEVATEEVAKDSKKKAPKEKKPAKEKKPFVFGLKFGEQYDKLQASIPALIVVIISALIVMTFVALVVFFNNVQGPERVLVPNVTGKKLEDALLEMQVKELYPKINLRYSDVPGDEGTILSQSPEAGAIVRGYSRVSLVVSRGIIIDKVDDYIGQNIDEVQLKIQTLFAGQPKPLIILAKPEYKPDASDAGTILEQDPPAGTSISEPVTVQLVVSRGPNYENTRAPNVLGQSVNDLLQTITRSKIVFDITGRTAVEGERAGVVVSQQKVDGEYVPNYSRFAVELTIPEGVVDGNVYGVFSDNLIEYPYPVPMKLVAVPSEGDSYTIVSFNHPGGAITIPYAVPQGTNLVLYVSDKVVSRQSVN